jgi:KipI family sensor histidine kinase inhibitor
VTPLITPLGDRALLVRFGDRLTDEANAAAIELARRIEADAPTGVLEIVPNLISVLLRYEPAAISYEKLAGEVRLVVAALAVNPVPGFEAAVRVVFDGEDIGEVAGLLGLSAEAFVSEHNRGPLRVLATGFAPGFVYCGMHDAALVVPRRQVVRRQVPAGTVLFAAGQTAITSTAIPTGWHVIGHTDFRNFDPAQVPPSTLVAGDTIRFEAS